MVGLGAYRLGKAMDVVVITDHDPNACSVILTRRVSCNEYIRGTDLVSVIVPILDGIIACVVYDIVVVDWAEFVGAVFYCDGAVVDAGG